MGPVAKKNQNSDGYKPTAIPKALKVINGHRVDFYPRFRHEKSGGMV
ncbi:MAG: hypothetical protein K0Q73_7986 [Paenibacillus sp.]|nr:hypothetical protein [Paenibacillus sp.]